MYQQRIEEQNQDSLSLNDNTLIQQYNQLDYSDEYEHSDSSKQHSLSQSHRIQLRKIQEIHNSQDSSQHQQQQLTHHNRQKHFRDSVRPIKNIESKYDFGISPSTKEEQSILNANQLLPRKSNQNPQKIRRKMVEIYSEQNGSNNDQKHNSKQWKPEEEEQESLQSKIESGRQARLSQHRKPEFNINSFLNAEPVPFHSKKGLKVLNKSLKEQSFKKQNYSNGQLLRKEAIKEEDTINLITLPEIEIIQNDQMLQKMKNAENELSKLKASYDRRFKQARLSFIDNFLPQPLKIKSNPYNLFKYISRSYN